VLLFDQAGRLARRFASNNLPLGILRTSEGVRGIEPFGWAQACQLMLVSDGVIEAHDPTGEQFGEERLANVLDRRPPGAALIDTLQQALQAHLSGGHAHDDMSILVIDCPANPG
jgi:serine phosphatase RsbU (regulator of sigma subunit)